MYYDRKENSHTQSSLNDIHIRRSSPHNARTDLFTLSTFLHTPFVFDLAKISRILHTPYTGAIRPSLITYVSTYLRRFIPVSFKGPSASAEWIAVERLICVDPKGWMDGVKKTGLVCGSVGVGVESGFDVTPHFARKDWGFNSGPVIDRKSNHIPRISQSYTQISDITPITLPSCDLFR